MELYTTWIWFLIKVLSVVLQINVKNPFKQMKLEKFVLTVDVPYEWIYRNDDSKCVRIKFVITIIIIILWCAQLDSVRMHDRKRDWIEGAWISYLRLVSVK